MILSVAVVAFAACNNNPGGPPALEGDGDIVWDENGNVVYIDVRLKMWSVTTGDDANTQDQIVAEFNRMCGLINVTVEHYSRYDLETLLSNTMQFDKKNAPDMLFNHGSRVTEYNERGWLQEVDFFGKSGAVVVL